MAAWPTARFAHADEVVLTSGERFTSSKVWEENGKILFDMQGLIVSVSMADVAAIIRGTGNPSLPAVSPELPLQNRPEASPSGRVQTSSQKPAAPVVSEKPVIRNQTARNPEIRGIGLDGLVWQMKPTEIPGIEKLETDPSYGGIDQYWWPGGNLTLGNALLDGLVFGFWQNRLYSIMIWVNGNPGYTRLQQAVFDRYGPGAKNETGLERYIWRDNTTDRMLEFDAKLNTGIFWMRSKNLDQQIKRLYPE